VRAVGAGDATGSSSKIFLGKIDYICANLIRFGQIEVKFEQD